LVGNFASGFVSSHFFIAVQLSAVVFLVTYFKYCSRGLPTTRFPDIAPSRMFTTNSLCLFIRAAHDWRLFFKIFKIIYLLSPSVSLSVILSVNSFLNIPLQHHVSNPFTTLSSFSPTVHVSDPLRATFQILRYIT
jgi:hypothetical protein